ncbi:MAG TPA: hypothetical protein PLQ36_01940 [Candidatus Gracilibacteria bacterium]|nr:hypothetical protein [Candidatus Gracilibacteria bacterium]
MSKLSEKVSAQILAKKIKPKSKWYFRSKNYLYWGGALLFLVLASLSAAMIRYFIGQAEPDLIPFNISPFFWTRYLIILPYLWIVLLTGFLSATYYYLHHTKNAYRYRFGSMGLMIVLGSLALAVVWSSSHMERDLHGFMAHKMDWYQEQFDYPSRLWQKPQAGFLAGEIQQLDLPTSLSLQDFDQQIWQVQISAETKTRNINDFKVGDKVKIMGEKQENFQFRAFGIRPWEHPIFPRGKNPPPCRDLNCRRFEPEFRMKKPNRPESNKILPKKEKKNLIPAY